MSVSHAERLEDEQDRQVREALRDRISEGTLDLPVLPKVAGAVMAMVQEESSDMSGLARLIQQDQALASRVMKRANSPLYRGVNPMSSLQQAIARMGMKTISEIALAASVGSGVFRVEGYETEISVMWRHSLAAGAWAREIARIRRRNVESAFMCGLLHQIGKPVTLQALSEIHAESGDEVCDLPSLLDDFHVEVGISLGIAWELPAMIVESIEYYRDYASAGRFRKEAMITAGADLLARELVDRGEVREDVLLESDVMADLNFYEDDLTDLVAQTGVISEMIEVMAL